MFPVIISSILIIVGISVATQQGRVPTAPPGDRTPYSLDDNE